MKIGIYGGTFDPPHLGHMEAARTALEQMNLDRLIIIPDCEPPHKDLAEEAATPQQRLEMAALMADGPSKAPAFPHGNAGTRHRSFSFLPAILRTPSATL